MQVKLKRLVGVLQQMCRSK